MATTRGAGPRDGSSCGVAGSHRRAEASGAKEGACGQGLAWRSARQSNSEKPGALAEANAHRCRLKSSDGTWLAEYIHIHQKSFRIFDSQFSRRQSFGRRGCGSSRDSGIVAGKAIHGMERRDQHVGFAFLFAWYLLSPAADERSKMSRHYSSGSCLPRNDADLRCAGGATACTCLSPRYVGRQRLQYGPLDRTDWPGTPKILSGARRIRASSTTEIRCDSGIESTLRIAVRAGSESNRGGDQSDRRAFFFAASSGAGTTRTGESHQAGVAV